MEFCESFGSFSSLKGRVCVCVVSSIGTWKHRMRTVFARICRNYEKGWLTSGWPQDNFPLKYLYIAIGVDRLLSSSSFIINPDPPFAL